MHGEQSGGKADTPRYRTMHTGEFMGIFDKVEKDAEEAMAQDEPNLAQRADGRPGAVQAVQAAQDMQATRDMQAARNLIGKQRGARDQDQDQDGSDQDYSDEDW